MVGQMSLEVAVFGARSAMKAQEAGAQRIELNASGSYFTGGLTPSVQELISIAPTLKIPVRIMIRPAGHALPTTGMVGQSDFDYSPFEFDLMQESIRAFKEAGVMNPVRGDGFVFGIVKKAPHARAITNLGSVDQDATQGNSPNGDYYVVDKERCNILTELASPFPCVFHRAFDPIAASDRMFQGLEDLQDCGFEGLLTSGGPGPHMGHVTKLASMVGYLQGRLQVIVGGGVRASNAGQAVATLGINEDDAVWLHSACLNTPKTNVTQETEVEMVDTVEIRDLLGEIQMTKRA